MWLLIEGEREVGRCSVAQPAALDKELAQRSLHRTTQRWCSAQADSLNREVGGGRNIMLLAQIQLVVTEQFTARRLWQMFQFLQLGAQFQTHAGHLITASAGGLVLHFVLVAALQELRMLLQRLQMLLASLRRVRWQIRHRRSRGSHSRRRSRVHCYPHYHSRRLQHRSCRRSPTAIQVVFAGQ